MQDTGRCPCSTHPLAKDGSLKNCIYPVVHSSDSIAIAVGTADLLQ